ncbi:condensin subunit YCS4 KNAG_0I01740 [Huiozyma naganishii CBS 8797]|uniref:Condensin complex subunit 1 n=1 Tax=Huiozyma naganishii (strain ATCC MYA-139 / BCRC 22969 / CBS 8797 / KCTC 17520 / NBRC 10181 / NCYC 3082 / Yp74L-3) TaxID=1071383 RepID=J7S990_HUIN7|nr:hypothetical protein KNAG_0I01740 [Kazachstania naganishii CBS 8797]CCK71959.1 hypothetical protein KNAG_0I01740 [Kazachstania naganishii CBS 8797]
MLEFNLAEYLTRFQIANKDEFPPVDSPSSDLNAVTDRLAVSPEQINDQETFDTLVDLCHGFVHLQVKLQSQLTYLVSSSLSNVANDINANISNTSDYNELADLVPQWKSLLEAYGYLTHALLFFLQEDVHRVAAAASSSSSSSNLGRNRKSATNDGTSSSHNVELFKRSCSQIESLCETTLAVLALNLSTLFQTTPEKDLFVGLFTRPLYSLIEVEASIKLTTLKLVVQRVLAVAVKSHGQASNARSAIMSNLTYFLHLSNFNAELLALLYREYNYPQLTEDVLKEISSRDFNSKDTTGPRSISIFLIKLSDLSPLIMLRQMSLLLSLLNNSSMTLRSAIVEACGNIIVKLSSDSASSLSHKQQIMVLIELLEERFQDSNPYVRTKAIQGCIKLIDLNVKLGEKRSSITNLAVRSLGDRSSLVRRNTIKLLSKLLLRHPFSGINGTQLKLSHWEKCLEKVEEETSKYPISEDAVERLELAPEREDQDMDNAELSRLESQAEAIQSTNPDAVLKLKLLVVYHKDAVAFIKSMHKAVSVISSLLLSKNRNEVLEAMDFLVLTEAFDLEPSRSAIKKMLHLVWIKGTNDEGTSIATHLVECYQQLFFTAPENYTQKQRAFHIAMNVIEMTIGASVADLTSLEKLLGMMYEKRLINAPVIEVLWEIYSSAGKRAESNGKERYAKEQIHGSINILGMLALANHEIVANGMDNLLRVGLGDEGTTDLVLCRYSCIALQRLAPKKGNPISPIVATYSEEEAVKKIYSKIIAYTTSLKFYPMCEQALNALFMISSQPDAVASNIIKEKTMMTFGKPDSSDDSIIPQEMTRVCSLTQLLFIVGQVAIRILVYLEKCEAQFRKKKIGKETARGKHKESATEKSNGDLANASNVEEKDNELAMIGGTNEDDFSDAIQFVKENELLYQKNSLLGKFCPIVEEIVSNSTRFNDVMLQRVASLCLEKLMCISSKYCEKSLPLLITVMEKSEDPIIRSNAVLALGDMAVCFNNLVDENTDYLYRRLHDDNLMVQRTCLMTVTFLILAGQVKVKGQLGEMAKCLENSDQNISDMCRLFFSELATKDNAIYNGFIDIFSNLSADKQLGKESFKKIIKFLLSFIDKDRHQKQLSEKLIGRLGKCSTQKQWDDIAFVLSNLSFTNERISAILEEGFKMVSVQE